MNVTTLLVLDTIEDRLVPQSRELLGFAAALGRLDRAQTLLVVPGSAVSAVAAELAEQYGLQVVCCEHEQLYYPNPELLRCLLRETIAEFRPQLIAFLHTMRNCQTAAALGVDLEAAIITAVEACSAGEGGLTFRRSVAGGKLLQSVRPTAAGSIVTILPGAFLVPAAGGGDAAAAPIIRRRSQDPCRAYLPIGLERGGETGASLDDAAVVVAAGRGIGSEETLSLISDVARIFANAAVGASRPLCDLKWLPYCRQVGVTGKTITPRLYLACGISGAQQHLAGIRGADCIVAINSDPEAAICAVADYIVVDDLHAFLPQLLQQYRERFGQE